MKERTLLKDLSAHIGSTVTIAGMVDIRRDHGKLIFLVVRDRTSIVQAVVHASAAEAFAATNETRVQSPVKIVGTVVTRGEKMQKPDEQNGTLELQITALTVLGKTHELPFEIEADVNLETYFDHLPLTLRKQRARDIFTVQGTIVNTYRETLRVQGFAEFQAPALVGGDAEGGAAVFKVGYYEHEACLATSPQFYKQIMVGPFERAFTIAKIFRAEKSATTRHLSELTQMDFEMGFIDDHTEVMAMLETVVRSVVAEVEKQHAPIFAKFGSSVPLVGEKFTVLSLTEAQEILEKEYSLKCLGEQDMEPEHERLICEWSAREKGCDFVFITHYPTAKRAFYTYADAARPGFSKSFDLLFRGLEINSGSQRIHDYDEMIAKIKERGMDPDKFGFYLEAFKCGMPPHGGCSTGLERLTARMLELKNVKEASAFPRDMTRIDKRLNAVEESAK
jgi:nondiscriminating aspartyl-tRNA synthetase